MSSCALPLCFSFQLKIVRRAEQIFNRKKKTATGMCAGPAVCTGTSRVLDTVCNGALEVALVFKKCVGEKSYLHKLQLPKF